jgi:hypothetical protein
LNGQEEEDKVDLKELSCSSYDHNGDDKSHGSKMLNIDKNLIPMKMQEMAKRQRQKLS